MEKCIFLSIYYNALWALTCVDIEMSIFVHIETTYAETGSVDMVCRLADAKNVFLILFC